MTWHIRPFQLQDEEPYLNLLAEWVTNVSVRERYQWLHRNNPHGTALTWLAIDNQTQRIVGCSSSFPKKVWLRDRFTLCTIGGDTYVAPEWRRKGIIDSLHKAILKERQDRDMAKEFGFSLAANIRALIKTGYQVPGDFLDSRKLLSVKPLLKKAKLAGMFPAGVLRLIDEIFLGFTENRLSRLHDSKYVVSEMVSFDDSFEALIAEVTPSFNICCLRDMPFLRWRFLDNPFRKYTLLKITEQKNGKLHGYAALEGSGDCLLVSDLFVRREDEVVESLLRALIKYGVAHSFNWISMKINPEGPYGHNLIRCGFKFNTSNRYPFIVWSEHDKEYFVNLKNWYLTVADLDI